MLSGLGVQGLGDFREFRGFGFKDLAILGFWRGCLKVQAV